MNDQNNQYNPNGYMPQQGYQYPQGGPGPQQPQPQYQQQPIQPQGYPPQQPMYQQPVMSQGYPQQPAMQQQPMLAQMPQYHMPAQDMAQAFQQTKVVFNSGGNYVKFPGPDGSDKWNQYTPIGYKSVVRVYILPPWTDGKYIFTIGKSHFWKSASKPKGASIVCPGEGCEVCKAKQESLNGNDPDKQEKAKMWGKVRTEYYYQVAMLDNPNLHFQGEAPSPFILQAGQTLHNAIGNLIEDKGIGICDPNNGRPLKLKKEKKGPQNLDIEYSCTDEDSIPLPQMLWPLLQNLIDLEALIKNPTQQEMMEAVNDMGLAVNIGNPYAMQYPMNPQQPMYQQPMLMQQGPMPLPTNPPMPNLVQPMPVNMMPPPVTSNPVNTNYAPQPSQQQPQQQPAQQQPQSQYPQQPIQQTAQQPQQPVSRQPVTDQPQPQQQPQSLEDIQNMVRGNR